MTHPPHELLVLRASIDRVDAHLLRLMARRLRLAARIAAVKSVHKLPVSDPIRERHMLADREQTGETLGCSAPFVRAVWILMITEAKKIERRRHEHA